MPRPKLTLKQERFIQFYLESGNASDAARKAGYSKKTAARMGQENLQKPSILTALEKARAAAAQRNHVTIEEITQGHRESFKMAKRQKQSSAMTAAMKNLSELHGLLVQKHEHSGGDKPLNIEIVQFTK